MAAYKDYVTGNGNYYRFDSGYTGGDITINPDADYSEITDAIKDAMQAAIASGKNLTNALSDMQKAFTSALDKLNGTLGDISDNTQETNKWLELIYQLLEDQQTDLQDYFASAGESLDDLIGLLSHTDSDGSRTSIYDLLGSFLLLFRVQQEDLQAYMNDAQDFFKMLPVEIGIFFRSATKEITDAIQDVVDAIDGIRINIDYGDVDGDGSDSESLWKLLGEGVAKILTAILGLLKVLIFKGLDALAYLVGVVVDNVNGVFEELTSTVDVIISDLEESNALYADLGEAIPVQIQNILVLFVFVLGFCAILSYLRR
ncbi:MAG: hypothetical protein HDQ98_02875 [Lachnospiraceae bacterium]|nr:hypothetical protein [Lachnospiraceae bacterium]